MVSETKLSFPFASWSELDTADDDDVVAEAQPKQINFERLTGSVKVQTKSRSLTLRTSMRLDLTVAT